MNPYDTSNLIHRAGALAIGSPLRKLRCICESQKTISTARLNTLLDEVHEELKLDAIRLRQVAKLIDLKQ